MIDPTRPTTPGAEDERALLAGALIAGADTARKLLGMVQPFMLADVRIRNAWRALDRVLQGATGPVDGLIDKVADDLAGEAGDAPSRVDLHSMTAAVPSTANVEHYGRAVLGAFCRREALRDVPGAATLDTADLLTLMTDRIARLTEYHDGRNAAPVARPVADFADAPLPAPVLWRDNPAAPDSTDIDAVLSVGECAVLASAGGLGKSSLVLELATAAAAAAADGRPYYPACGLAVAAGPVLLVSFEDSPQRIAHRAAWMSTGAVPSGLHVAPAPEPLWCADPDRRGESRPGRQWAALWRYVREIGARLLVVDPVSAALSDVSTTETGPVRAFMRALTAEAETAGAAVLLVAHDTKAARNAVADGADPGAGAVAGSAAWYDGARGVLTLVRPPDSDHRLLRCVKANYGRTGWGARLTERLGPGGAFRGLIGASMDRTEIDSATRPPPNRNGRGEPAPAERAALDAL